MFGTVDITGVNRTNIILIRNKNVFLMSITPQ